MQPILSIHVGGCGVRVGAALWERLCVAHGVSASGAFNGEVPPASFFAPVSGGRVIPRALFIDSDPSSLIELRQAPYGALFRPDDLVGGTGGCQRRYGVGLAHPLATSARQRLDALLGEAPDQLLLTCSLGGGAGAGLSAALVTWLRASRPDAAIVVAALTRGAPQNLPEVYNQALGLAALQAHADLVVLLDQDSLETFLAAASTHEGAVNGVVADALALLLAPLRRASEPAALDLRELIATLAPRRELGLAGLTLGADRRDPLAALARGGLSGYRLGDGRLLGELWVHPADLALDGRALWRDARLPRAPWRIPNLRVAAGPPSGTAILCAACHSGLDLPLGRWNMSFEPLVKRRAFFSELAADGITVEMIHAALVSLNQTRQALAELAAMEAA